MKQADSARYSLGALRFHKHHRVEGRGTYCSDGRSEQRRHACEDGGLEDEALAGDAPACKGVESSNVDTGRQSYSGDGHAAAGADHQTARCRDNSRLRGSTASEHDDGCRCADRERGEARGKVVEDGREVDGAAAAVHNALTNEDRDPAVDIREEDAGGVSDGASKP